MTEIDYTALKNEVITILKAEATLWDNINNGDNGTFTMIERGLPNNNKFDGLKYPCCFVTNDETLETDKPFGPVIANVGTVSEHIVKLKIIFFNLDGDGQAVEDSLDALHKIIKETLKADFNLGGLVTESWTTSSTAFSGDYRGKALDGRIIILVCKIHTS